MSKKKTSTHERTEQVGGKIKPNSTYVMSKRARTMLALMPFRDAEDRNTFKRQMIQAELAERDARNKPLSLSKKDREDVSERT